MSQTFDVVVIGGGPAGENAAWYARDNGLSVAIVERELLGGECSYWACMPSKALLRPGEALNHARAVPGAAAAITGEVDVEATLRTRDRFASNFDDEGQQKWVDSIGAVTVRGRGRLAGPRRVEVETEDGETITLTAAKAVVVATGTRAAMPPIDGLREADPWDSRDVTTAKEIPNRLLILGGGVVGVEMAQAYRSLGSSQVTIIEAEDRLLPREEPFVGEHLAEVFADRGIRSELGQRLTRVEREGTDGPVHVVLADGTELVGDELVVAVGRTPNTEGIGLETVGLEPGGYIEVDDQLRATGVEDNDWLYVVGDANGRALLTHQGKYQARQVGDIIAGRPGSAWADNVAVPGVVFTDPQVASVGRTEAEAREAGINVKTVRYSLGHVAAGSLYGKGAGGPAQLVIDEDRRVIIGATFVGPNAGELLHAATIAIVGEVPIDRLWHAVPSFPTLSEVWLRLLEQDRDLI